MNIKKNILVIIGSASANSSNERLVEIIAKRVEDYFNVSIYKDLKTLPHFDPKDSVENPPNEVVNFRQKIEEVDGIIICTPEYVFSIPSGLKNAIEWCVSTTVFSEKPLGIITASAHGEKGHEELKMIMRTVMAKFTDNSTLLIQGIKSEIDLNGTIVNTQTASDLEEFIFGFSKLVFQENSR